MNSFINAGIFFLSASVLLLIAVKLFDLITKYKIWEEITKGNVSVALATGGIILGIANIMRFSISSNERVLDAVIWGGTGTLALIVVYLAFELLTPRLNVSEEIAKGNKAVGLISFIFSLAFSYIIGASIV